MMALSLAANFDQNNINMFSNVFVLGIKYVNFSCGGIQLFADNFIYVQYSAVDPIIPKLDLSTGIWRTHTLTSSQMAW